MTVFWKIGHGKQRSNLFDFALCFTKYIFSIINKPLDLISHTPFDNHSEVTKQNDYNIK